MGWVTNAVFTLEWTFESLGPIYWSQQCVDFHEPDYRCWSPPNGSFRSPGINAGCISAWSVFAVSGILLRSCVRSFFSCRFWFQPGFHLAEYCTVLKGSYYPPRSRGNELARVHSTVPGHLFWVPRIRVWFLGDLGLPSHWLSRGLLKKGGVTDGDSWMLVNCQGEQVFPVVFSVLLLLQLLPSFLLSPACFSKMSVTELRAPRWFSESPREREQN